MRFASRSSLLTSLVLGVVCLPPLAARAQTTFISTNTTLDASNPVTSGAVVGYANQNDLNNGTNPTSPTVSLVSGGSVDAGLLAYNSSTINVRGGVVNNSLVAYNSSVVNLSGGIVNNSLVAYNSSVVNVSGGIVNNDSVAYDSSSINFFGTGQIATLLNANYFNLSRYSLSGTLSDGTVLLNNIFLVQNGTGAKFTLNNVAVTPEPGSIALLIGLTTTSAGFLSRRRKAIKNAA